MSTPDAAPLRVLVVDDDAEILEIIRERLQMEGFEVEVTTSAGTALARFLTRRFDVMLLDIQIGGIDGLSLLRLARLSEQDAAVVMISGAGDLSQAVSSLRLGADDYICKPFKIWDLRDRVRSALNRRRTIATRTQTEAADVTRKGSPRGEPASPRELLERLRALAIAVERSMANDAGHIDRVAQLVGLLGGELNLSAEELRHLRLATELHDLGHAHLPDEKRLVLVPAGDYARAYREHAAISAACVEAMGPEHAALARTIRHHHESWNGAGFPAGLSGDRIPWQARVLRLADDFARLAADRPAGQEQQVLATLLEHGSHYDPELLGLLGKLVHAGALELSG